MARWTRPTSAFQSFGSFPRLLEYHCERPVPTFRQPFLKGHTLSFVWFILIGLAAGWLAGQLMKGSGYGVLGDIVVGVIGSFLGGFIFSTLGIWPGGGLIGSLIVATIGAVLLLFLLRLIKRPGV